MRLNRTARTDFVDAVKALRDSVKTHHPHGRGLDFVDEVDRLLQGYYNKKIKDPDVAITWLRDVSYGFNRCMDEWGIDSDVGDIRKRMMDMLRKGQKI